MQTISQKKTALKFVNQADREYLAMLNRRIAKGEKHLIELANQFLPVVGSSSRELNKMVGA